ncbi:HCNGP-like protein-domain-containing protein [Lophiotrema nucula]|uniref:HCNGP-like protein-domain-containing protein n=1 Tax=Lophiotrema nucula TaxID=690887 RepID=A0A6A5YPU4_9PLEO|nr:HCNGP-like protein-domain-containing protein [Lophiotrema nucula]
MFNRSQIRNLTLPTVPNFNIPPSPPGSPPQRATRKFAQFLELKKKGQHFNQRLESSSVMKDPGHLQRLLDFAGLSQEGQYTSTLPAELAVPTEWPAWAYVEQLSEARKQMSKAKEEEKAQGKRDKVKFVKATESGTSSGTGTSSGGGGTAGAQSAAERIVAGLGGRKPGKTDSRNSSRKRELERRGGRGDYSSRGKHRSRSRSPRRRRSRSTDRDRRRDRSRDRR